VFKARVGEKRLAMRLEYRVKRLSKIQKEQLVKNRRHLRELIHALQMPSLAGQSNAPQIPAAT
jgi:putative endonuclease